MKPSGKSVQNDVQISNQEIMVELTNQTLAERGYIQCQIEIKADDPLEPIISADTAQTPEGSYLLTGYIDGLRARNNETVIAALSNQVVALTQKSMEG